MMTKQQQPLVEQYFAELTHAASRLPRGQRTELLAEIRSHLDDGLTEATSESDIRNMLDALGSPADIVEAAEPTPANGAQGSTGRLALGLGILGLILAPTIVIGIVLGMIAVLLGAQAHRSLRAEAQPTTIATISTVLGFVDIILPVVMILLLEASF